jgi:hypothetical protein
MNINLSHFDFGPLLYGVIMFFGIAVQGSRHEPCVAQS